MLGYFALQSDRVKLQTVDLIWMTIYYYNYNEL